MEVSVQEAGRCEEEKNLAMPAIERGPFSL
jgi:hypothetical protein